MMNLFIYIEQHDVTSNTAMPESSVAFFIYASSSNLKQRNNMTTAIIYCFVVQDDLSISRCCVVSIVNIFHYFSSSLGFLRNSASCFKTSRPWVSNTTCPSVTALSLSFALVLSIHTDSLCGAVTISDSVIDV